MSDGVATSAMIFATSVNDSSDIPRLHATHPRRRSALNGLSCHARAAEEASPWHARCNLARCLALVLLAGLLSTVQAAAQTGLATVTGLVSDSSAAALPGVTVTATNQATHIAYHGTTNEAGNYVITSVPIGEYVISAALPGFKGVQTKVTLSVAQTARVDFRMEVGNVEEKVDVVATERHPPDRERRRRRPSRAARPSSSCRP